MSEAPRVAVVGLACRLPGAADEAAFWSLLAEGREGTTRFSREELLAAGRPASLVDDPAFVPVRGVVEGADCFDAAFFSLSPGEAERTDPQHRVFLEACWAALENAGIDPERFEGSIGLWAGCSPNTYLVHNLLAAGQGPEHAASLAEAVGSDKDHLTTRAAYKLGLTGPAVTVQTACSTSLVAVHLAVQALLDWQCDVALAGGVSITPPLVGGHRHQPGSILSPDGRTRSFDARAGGTVSGDGVGVVVLRRLEDAVEQGDRVRAVVLGSAINNDGARKISYSAPSIDGQAEVIALAQGVAEVEPADIGLVEAHGTGTLLGDPVEVAALRQVFGGPRPEGRCALGSVKSNVGHLNAAAGVAGFIKAVLSLERAQVPSSLHFEEPNPALALSASPFYVPTGLDPWPRPGARRAAVSSFGAGGTNAHVVLEQGPDPRPSPDAEALLLLSARDEPALRRSALALADHLEAVAAPLPDVAHTLHRRPRLPERLVVRAPDRATAIAALRGRAPAHAQAGRVAEHPRKLLFAVPAMGTQRLHMGRALAAADPVFDAAFREAVALGSDLLGEDVLPVLWPDGDEAEAQRLLDEQERAGIAVFATGWALSRAWTARGLVPDAVLGHSTGEYVAAAIAGIWGWQDALRVFMARSAAVARLPGGSLLFVALSAEEARAHLPEDGAWIALVNSPGSCVVAGLPDAVADFRERLGEDVPVRPVAVSLPAHTPLLEPAVGALEAACAGVAFAPPRVAYFSGVTGGRFDGVDAGYWPRHMLRPIRFDRVLASLSEHGDYAAVELGPARSLSVLLQRNLPDLPVLPSLLAPDEPGFGEPAAAAARMDTGVAARWAVGATGDPPRPPGRVLSLPTYPFARDRHWIGAGPDAGAARRPTRGPGRPRPPLPTPHRAPATPAERALLPVVEELLGYEGLGVDDGFFDLGGDSLVTLRLLNQVERRFGRRLPPAAAFQGRTVAALARYLDVEEEPGPGDELPPSLVPIRTAGARPPLFMVHPAAGIVFPYFELARLLGDDQPFYGLQAHGLDGRTEPDRRTEDAARHYVDAIRAVQPEGPYRIAGYSYGCFIAFEMAKQLAEAGQQIAFLGLVDEPAPLPGHRAGWPVVARVLLGRAGGTFVHHLHDYLFLASEAGERRSLLKRVPRSARGLLQKSAMAALLPRDSHLLALDQPAMAPMFELFLAHLLELRRYRTTPYPGPATVFRSDWSYDRPFWEREDPDPALGWGELAQAGVTVRRISGDHLAVLRRPHVEVLAAAMREALDEVAGRSGTPGSPERPEGTRRSGRAERAEGA